MITSMGLPQSSQVHGFVHDANNNVPIQYASVSIVRTIDGKIESGGITNSEGYYTIGGIPNADYRVKIEFIGYTSFLSPDFIMNESESRNLGIVKLNPKVLQGSMVEVSGERPSYEVQVDKKVYNIEQFKTVVGGTCCDVLKKIPSLNIGVDGTVSLRGTSNVTILIDEKRAGILGGERKTNAVAIPVPAGMIDRIEVITSPSAKYDPDGMSGIVNIILKEEKQTGYNSEISVNAGHTGKLISNAIMNYRWEKLNLYTKGNLDITERSGNGYRNITLTDPEQELIYKSNEVSQIQVDRSVHFLNFGSRYYFSKNNQLTFDLKFTRSNKILDDSTFFNLNGFQPDKTINTKRSVQGSNQSYAIGYTFQNTTNAFLNAELTHDIYDERSNQDYLLNKVVDRSIESDLNKSYSVIKIDYFNTLIENLVLESGYKGRFMTISKDYGIITDKYRFGYEENIQAVYSTLTYIFSEDLSIKPGLRFEWVNSVNESILVEGFEGIGPLAFRTRTIMDNYNRVYPTANAAYKINSFTNVQLGFSRRVNRPEFSALDPFPKHFFYSSIDTLGNPELMPEFINDLEFGYYTHTGRIKFDISLYHHSITDLIMWEEGLVSDSLSIYSFENYGDGKLVGSEFNVRYSPISSWDISLNGNPFRYDIYKPGGGNEYYKGSVWRMVNTVKHPQYGKIELNGSYHSPHLLSTGKIWPSGKFILDMAYQTSFFNEKMTVTLKVTDTLDDEHYKRNISEFDKRLNVHSSINSYRRPDEPTIYLSVQYKFGDI